MCDKKPGRRCSSDTRATLYALKATSDNLEQQMQVLAQRDASSPEFNGMESWEHAALMDQYNKNKSKLDEAELNYYTSPEGTENLEKWLDYDAGKEYSIDFEAQSTYDGSRIAVTAPIPAGIVTGIKLNSAKSHREWQAKTVKSLVDAETRSPEAALFAATNLRETMEVKLKTLKHGFNNSDVHLQYEEAIEGYSENPNSEKRQQLSDAYHAHEKHKTLMAYANLKINDLKSYEADMTKKVTTKTLISKPLIDFPF